MRKERERRIAEIIRMAPRWADGALDDNNRHEQIMSGILKSRLKFPGSTHLVNAFFPSAADLVPDGDACPAEQRGSLDERFTAGGEVTVRKSETGGLYLITKERSEDGIWIQAAQRLLVAPRMGERLLVIDFYSEAMPLYPLVEGIVTSNAMRAVVDLSRRIIDAAKDEDFIVWGHLDAPSFLELGKTT